DILIGELPGGSCAAWVLLEKVGDEYKKDTNGCPILPIFKVGKSVVPKMNGFAPVFSEDTSWSVWKANSEGSSALDAFRPH
ncbi:MAG: hypothetical protein WCH43_08805, partial [Verrucomicrobiota bacterium]